eukprot:210813-Pelagomonas_calceolata.AAC.2
MLFFESKVVLTIAEAAVGVMEAGVWVGDLTVDASIWWSTGLSEQGWMCVSMLSRLHHTRVHLTCGVVSEQEDDQQTKDICAPQKGRLLWD